ncbi:MAG: M24 family metallopeptidase [Vicinamibacterales bacterium]
MDVPPSHLLAARLAALRAALAERRLDGLLVESLPSIAYLTGFRGSAGLLLVTDRVRLVVDGRYVTVATALAEGTGLFELVALESGESYDEVLAGLLAGAGAVRLGIEDEVMSVRRHRGLLERASREAAFPELVATDGLVDRLRVVKDSWELSRLREGGRRLSEVAKCILPRVLAGRLEREVAADIEDELRRAGFERPAFDTIVAGGPNAALPHHRAGERRIAPGDLVILDFGGVFQGYCTDLSRTVIVPPASPEASALVSHVAEAQRAAIRAAGPGVAPEAVDQAARDVLERAGVGDRFTHGTGHGLGLEVHERPRISRARPGHAEPRLEAGMVFTVEPGAYVPGWGGVRIEDDVLVTAEGREVLTGDGTE